MAPRNSPYYPDGRHKQFTIVGGNAKPVPHKMARKTTSMASVLKSKQDNTTAATNQSRPLSVPTGLSVDDNTTIRDDVSIPDSQSSIWQGLFFTTPSPHPGTPDTQLQSKEDYYGRADEDRRQRLIIDLAKRRERWRASPDGDIADAQLQTWSQIQRDEENRGRSSGQEKRQRPPTANMMTDHQSMPSNTRQSSHEEGEIREEIASTSETFGRKSPLLKNAVSPMAAPHRTSPKTNPQELVEVDKAKAAMRSSPTRRLPRKQPSVQSISSGDSNSLIEPEGGRPAVVESSPNLYYRSRHVKQAAKNHAAQPNALGFPSITSDVVLTPGAETESQLNQARVDKISARQEEADPDFDADEAVDNDLDRDWKGIAGPSHRTRARSRHEADADFPILESDVDSPTLESDVDAGAGPNSATKRRAKAPSPGVPSAKKKKRGEGLRPGDSGWRFEKLSFKGKQQRRNLIDEMQSEWKASVETVVADDIRPRWIDGVAIVDGIAIGSAKMPHDWSTELLEALRNFSLQTSGRPEFATQVLRRAVQQQVARQGGSPALNKTDVAVAMHMAREGEVAPDMAPPFPELNTRTSQMSLRDRPEDVTTPNKPSAVVNPDQARAGNSEKAIAGATSSPPPQEADFEMILDSEPDIGLAEGSQRGQRDDQEWAAIPDQEPPTGPRSLQAGKRQREMQMKLAMLEYEEARARKKLVQADLDQILARRKLLHLGVDPDDL